jgi:post-segregation antitoxin (ccd killing protein)
MSFITSIAIPEPVLKRAKKLGINVSQISREAVIAEVKKKEQGVKHDGKM